MDAKQTSIFIAILIASLAVALIISYFVISLVRQQKRNAALYKAKMLAEITTLEQERKRMSADLHDDFGPVLAGIKLKLNSLELHDDRDKVTLDSVQQNINDLIGRMKEISNDLMPTILLRKGLIETIRVFTDEINRAGTLSIELVHQDIPPLSEEQSINLFRIFQEIFHNTLKHAGATKLDIELKIKKNILVFTTKDNGSGFEFLPGSKAVSGQGLRNLLSRTEVLKGNMFVDTGKFKGTAFTFEIPL